VSREVRLYLASELQFPTNFQVNFDKLADLRNQFVVTPQFLKANINDNYLSLQLGARSSAIAGI
jgi:hypothetical protein